MNRNTLSISKMLIILFCFVLTGCTGCDLFTGCSLFRGKDQSHEVTNTKAEKKKDEERFITVINGTDLTINSIEILAGDGIEIVKKNNPDNNSYSFQIDKTWEDYKSFRIILMDVYDLHYEKTITVPTTGKVDVKITQDDYVKYRGDALRLVDKKLNGD